MELVASWPKLGTKSDILSWRVCGHAPIRSLARAKHEVYELKFKKVTFPYRILVNSLIEAVEKLAYERKEKFLESLPKVSEVISK